MRLARGFLSCALKLSRGGAALLYVLALLISGLLLSPLSTDAAGIVATVPTGVSPRTMAVNPATNKIYVSNYSSGTVTVIDGATNGVTTVTAGTNPGPLAVNPATDKIYLANYGSNNVTVIDGVTNETDTVAVGTNPRAVAVNEATNKIYVANYGSNSVTVIDGLTNGTTTITVGANPQAIAVNPATNKIYVANYGGNSVTVIDGVTNGTTTITVGTNPKAVAVNPVTNKIYVANYGSHTVTVINGATNSTTAVATGSSPQTVSVNPVSNKIYIANRYSGTVTVLDGTANTTSTVTTGSEPWGLTVNPVSDMIYVTNYSSGTMTVIDGASNSTSAVTVGSGPLGVMANPVTNRIYAAISNSDNVSVIDGAANVTVTIDFSSQGSQVEVNPNTNKVYLQVEGVFDFFSGHVRVYNGSTNSLIKSIYFSGESDLIGILAINPITNKIYAGLGRGSGGKIVVIDGATDTVTTKIGGFGFDFFGALNPITNKIYLVNGKTGTVGVFDGKTNQIAAPIAAGTNPCAVAVNPVTNRIYVANNGSSNITVIDGATNGTTTIAAGTNPCAVAVNPVTNRIYAANCGSNTVTLIDGETDARVDDIAAGTNPGAVGVNQSTNKIYVINRGSRNVTVIDGVTNQTTTVAAGTNPNNVAVNPVTSKVYFSRMRYDEFQYNYDILSILAEQTVQPVPLTTVITPLINNASTVGNPTLAYTVSSAYAPTAPPVQRLYYQVDTWTGPWQVATPSGGGGSFAIPAQTGGIHTVYAFAGDGQESASINTGFGASPIPGSITAYTLLIPTTPGAPSIGTAKPGDGFAVVSFTPPLHDGASPITGFQASSSPGGITATGTTSPITVTGLSNGTAYTFTVKAVNAVGAGPNSASSNSIIPKDSVKAVTLAPTPVSPVSVGTTVVFTAAASGGSGDYEYQFRLRNPSGVWSVQQGYAPSGSWSWNTTALTIGNYLIEVWARNVGSASYMEAYKRAAFALTSPPVSAVTLQANPPSPQGVGTTITLTATASGGSGNYEYQFRLCNPSGVWSVQQGYAPSGSWSWNTAGLPVGIYTIEVWARNSGSSAAWEAYKNISFRLLIPSLTLMANRPSPQTVGTTIGFLATASGGSGSYEYQFRLRNPAGIWSVQQGYLPTDYWSWNTTGLSVGTYTVEVWARNAGSSAAWEANENMKYNIILPIGSVSLSADRPSPQSRGTSIIFTAAASGGSGNYEYQYRLRTPSGVWSVVRNYGSNPFWTWSTSAGQAAGTYKIEVWARNAGSNAAWEAYRNLGFTLQ